MAKQVVFSIFDSGVRVFFMPFQAPSIRDAKDSFRQLVNDPSTTVCKHPADFTLMELGTFDNEIGRFENLTAPISHGAALIYKDKPAETLPLVDVNQ